MEMSRDVDGALTPLKNRNIDTGMGLERMAQILQRVPNNYETDLILPIVSRAAQVAGACLTFLCFERPIFVSEKDLKRLLVS